MLSSIIGDLPKFLEKTLLLSYNSNKWSKYKQIICICYLFILNICGFIAIYYSGFQKALAGPAYFNVIGVITSCHQIFTLVNKDKVNQMLDIFTGFQQQRKHQWEKDIFIKESKMTWNFVYFYSLGLIIYEMCYQLLPIIFDALIGYIFPNFPSLRVPLFAQGFIDFTESRTVTNFLMSVPGILWCFIELLSHVGGQALIVVSVTYMRAEMKIVNEKLLIVKKTLNKNYEVQNMANVILEDAIIHHQKIIQGVEIMNRVLGFPIVVESTILSFCICLNLYGTLAFEGPGSTAVKLQGGYAILALVGILFWACSIGESLEDENSKIFTAIYDLPWYNDKVDIGNTVKIMMMQTRKPLFVNYHLRANLNLETFTLIINTSYSYFMMLKTTMH